MGSGFKDWTAGDVLTAADVDGYLMRQTAMTFADSSTRDTALSGVLDEGMIAYLEDVDQYTFYDGSAWKDISAASTIGTWTTFTPSWNNFTAGNAVQDWSYCIINDVMIVTGRTVLGSTSSMGTSPSFAIPDSRVADKWSTNGGVSLREDGVATRVGTISVNGPADSTIGFGAYLVSGTEVRGTQITSSVPFSWGTNDYISGTLVFDVT